MACHYTDNILKHDSDADSGIQSDRRSSGTFSEVTYSNTQCCMATPVAIFSDTVALSPLMSSVVLCMMRA